MGSVIDYIDCPNCGTEAFSDFYYKTGEEYVMCSNCGYHKSITIKDRDKLLNELTEDDWEIVEIANPFGSYSIKTYQSVGTQLGTLETEQQYNELKQNISDDVEIEWCRVSRLVDGDIVIEMLIDNEQHSND